MYYVLSEEKYKSAPSHADVEEQTLVFLTAPFRITSDNIHSQ